MVAAGFHSAECNGGRYLMLYFIPSAEDSLTYELAFEDSSSGSFSSVDYAASLLAESVQEITPQWIISNNLL